MFVNEIVKEKLFALSDEEGSLDVFHECFENWQDVSYLYNFFNAHPHALAYYEVDQQTAVRLIIKESKEFFFDILKIAEGKIHATTLDDIVFQPLHTGDGFDMPILETKAYGEKKGKSFLRLYAIRLKDGAYIIVGGLIKTTKKLQDCKEGIQLLDKMKAVANELRKKELFDAFDIGILLI